jgi:hypothetical protein
MKQQVYVAKAQLSRNLAATAGTSYIQLPIDVGAEEEVAKIKSCRLILRIDFNGSGVYQLMVAGGILRRSEAVLRTDWWLDTDVLHYAEKNVYWYTPTWMELSWIYDHYFKEEPILLRKPQLFIQVSDPGGVTSSFPKCTVSALVYYTIERVKKDELTKLMVKDRE